MKTLVLMSDIPWTALYQRPQALAVRFAMQYDRVIFVEPWHPTFKQYTLPPNVTRLRLWHWPFNARVPLLGRIFGPLSRVFHPLTDWVNRKILRYATGAHGPDVIFTESPQFGNLVKGWPLTTVVYDYIDRYMGFGRLPDWVTDAFYSALMRADLKIATHPKLADEIETPYVVGQGAEPAFGMARFGTRGIYWGYISDYMDWKTIIEDCDTGKILFLCGPVKGTEIPTHRNLHYLGNLPHRTLPYLARIADYGFILWKKTELTEAVSTVKAQEYLAAGLPVVYSSWMKKDMGPVSWGERAEFIQVLIETHTNRFNSSKE